LQPPRRPRLSGPLHPASKEDRTGRRPGGPLSRTTQEQLTESSKPSLGPINNALSAFENSVDWSQTYGDEADSLDDVDVADPLSKDAFDDIGEDGLGTFGDDEP